MAAVTKNLSSSITASTSFEPPFLLAKSFSTLDHMTKGRFAWNIVTSWKKSAFKAIGFEEPPEHDERYERADQYLRVVYKYLPLPLEVLRATLLTQCEGSGKGLGPTMQSRKTPRTTCTPIHRK
jgi:alkanesulfonate monooxygenase SsuD/methylene tetrahydromethanopterin reductase-like flavin-dependent oxidoreductase (luciferase family)